MSTQQKEEQQEDDKGRKEEATEPKKESGQAEVKRPYNLLLTFDERQAIDWVGYRYGHGDDLADLLLSCKYPEDMDWFSRGNILFELEEHQAWDLYRIGEEDNWYWTCFADELKTKLQNFCEAVI